MANAINIQGNAAKAASFMGHLSLFPKRIFGFPCHFAIGLGIIADDRYCVDYIAFPLPLSREEKGEKLLIDLFCPKYLGKRKYRSKAFLKIAGKLFVMAAIAMVVAATNQGIDIVVKKEAG